MDDFLFPLAAAEDYFRKFFGSVERDRGRLRFPAADGLTELTVVPINQRTADGYVISEIVTLTHVSPAIEKLSSRLVAQFNRWATLSAFVIGDATAPTRLVSKVGIFSADRAAAEHNYAPLLCAEAAISAWHAACMVRGVFELDPERSPLTMTDQDPPFDAADFEELKASADRAGHLASLGDRHFIVEFGWEEGAATRGLLDEAVRDAARAITELTDEQLDRLAGQTSLLQIQAATHPLYGKGIQCLLELPVLPEEPGASALANALNAWELAEADFPPHFGAWCVGMRAIAYVSFIPTQFCTPGLLRNLVVWMATRQAHARSWLMAPAIRH